MEIFYQEETEKLYEKVLHVFSLEQIAAEKFITIHTRTVLIDEEALQGFKAIRLLLLGVLD